MDTIKKTYFSYNDIHALVETIASKIKASGFEIDCIVAIGSGGFIPARILRTYLKKPIYAVGIAYYDSDDKATETPQKVQWIDEVERKLKGKNILLIDEVDDSRVTLEYCVKELLHHKPNEIAIAVIHNKLKEKNGSIPKEVKEYFVGLEIEDVWICYPWDTQDATLLSKDTL